MDNMESVKSEEENDICSFSNDDDISCNNFIIDECNYESDHVITDDTSISADSSSSEPENVSSEDEQNVAATDFFSFNDLIHVGSFVEEFQSELNTHRFNLRSTSTSKISRNNLLPTDTLANTLKSAVVEFLTGPKPTKDTEKTPFINFKCTKEMNMPDILSTEEMPWLPSKASKTIDLTPRSEVMLTVEIIEPFEFTTERQKRYRKVQPQQDVLILGGQSLDKLRDIISCVNDNMKILKTKKDYADPTTAPNAKDIFRSSMFFIGNTFYIDTRQKDLIDYSEVVRKWAIQSKVFDCNLVETTSMEKSYIKDLNIKFGHPYLFQHLGNCEHLIMFTNAKLIDANDELCSAMYPMVKEHKRPTISMCHMCEHNVATWLTIGNKRVPYDPAFFCENCYISFNFIKGKKVSNFTSYNFVIDDFHDKFRQMMRYANYGVCNVLD